MFFNDPEYHQAKQHELSRLLEGLRGTGIDPDQAERDAASINNRRIRDGARLRQLHPYSVGFLVERAIQREVLDRVQLDIVYQPESKTVDVTVIMTESASPRIRKQYLGED